MPTKRLPANPDLRHLRYQARDLQKGCECGDVAVVQRIREFHPRFSGLSDDSIRSGSFTVADAYLTLAREYGFSSWARLLTALRAESTDEAAKPHYDRIVDPLFRRAVKLIDDGDAENLRNLLRLYPSLANQHVTFEGENYFTKPSLLEFVAENPIRNESLPPNITEIAEAIIIAGASRTAITSTLGLVCSGRVPRECGVQGSLIELLCSAGASVDQAMLPTLTHGEFEAVESLLLHGASVDIAVAAALGRVAVVGRMLPGADAASRHRALALAAQHGHAEVVAVLLQTNEDPNRYNPIGCHSHSTPLHQAALAGHLEVVRILLKHGARTDIRDTLFDGTALQWAEYAKQEVVAAYLRSHA